MSATHPTERAVWPRGRSTVKPVDLARRPAALDGKTIAFLWDYIFRGDEIFPVLEEEIARRVPGVRFVRWDAFGATYGGDEHRTIAALPARLREHGIGAVVSGMGC